MRHRFPSSSSSKLTDTTPESGWGGATESSYEYMGHLSNNVKHISIKDSDAFIQPSALTYITLPCYTEVEDGIWKQYIFRNNIFHSKKQCWYDSLLRKRETQNTMQDQKCVKTKQDIYWTTDKHPHETQTMTHNPELQPVSNDMRKWCTTVFPYKNIHWITAQ